MKFLLQFFILLSIFFSACKPNHQGETKTGPLSITDNEDKGIKEIIETYSGRCEYGFEKKLNSDKKNETNFWIKFSQSTTIDSLSKIAELPGSNIAYIFYKNLDKEKNNYNQIQTELIFSDGANLDFNYTLAQLEEVKTKLPLVDKIVELIKQKKFNVIKQHLKVDTAIFNYNKDELILNLEKANGKYGDIKEFQMWGFKFFKTKNGQEILHIAGVLLTNKNGNYFSVNLNPISSVDEIYSLNYDL